MNEPAAPPTRLLRFVAGFARWSLGLLLAAWLLLTLAWGALHGWIVPRIDTFRPVLETHATRALGIPVHIGALSARTEGLIPTIELESVTLLDSERRPALLLPRVVVAVSPRSLLNLGFEQLYIERPDLDIRRTAEGHIQVAGLDIAQGSGDSSAATDWLFAQTELVIRDGIVRWNDELRGAPELTLSQVDLVMRNGNWRHQMRLDATPPAAWGDRFSLTGQFRAPLLHVNSSNWQQWSGQLYAHFSRVDVSRLRHHADIGVDLTAGHGAMRAWVDVVRGQPVGATADLALRSVSATLGKNLLPLALPAIDGRLGGRQLAGGFEFFTQALHFETDDGLEWPGGNVRLTYTEAAGKAPAQGEFKADRLDLAALAQIASRLPLGQATHDALRNFGPHGLVEEIQASWKGPLDALQQYQVKARINQLALAADTPGVVARTPGLRGARVEIDMNQAGGRATLGMQNGALYFPGVFEDPVLPLDRLQANLRWQVEGERIAVQATEVQFANADAEGEARATWQTADPRQAPHHARFPGILDLSGTLHRADGTRVHRYLPLTIPADSRHYVRDAVVAGKASNVQFKVKGNLLDLPYNDPKTGEFRIAAQVRDVTYTYVPPRLQPSGAPAWPALTQLAGELIFDRSSMQVRGASGSFAGSPGVKLNKVEARIPDLGHTVVSVSADARGPLPELLGIIATSPLSPMTGHALDKATGAGAADFGLRLTLPISDINKSRVQGSVTLAGNEVRITPETPPLARARGTIQFTEGGFTLTGVQARALGGDVRIEGGMRTLAPNAPPTESAVQIRAQGTATAEGLQQARYLGLVAQLARKATGSTPYQLQLAFRRGQPEVTVTTPLQGMALALPAPLAKPADNSLPLRFEIAVARESLASVPPHAAPPALRDQITLDLGGIGSAIYVRDINGPQPKVLRGTIAMGLGAGESAPMPAEGVAANIQLGKVDLAAWESLLPQESNGAAPGNGNGNGNGTAASAAVAQDYLPSTLALRAQEVSVQGRTLHQVVLGGLRQGALWRANLDARELNGYVEFRQGADAAAGRLFARLSRASIPQSEAQTVEALLDEQPGALPALDIVVDDLELKGKKLGRVEIEAQNRMGDGGPHEWRLSKFNVLSPEASFTASGNWAQLGTSRAASTGHARRTALNFRWDIRDSGELLARMGMANVVRRGKGRLEGQIAWLGAPFSPDYRSMAGQINVNVEAGQFLKADPGLAKLLGVLSLQSLPRRLTLDFRDVFSEGFAFDFVRGDVRIERGVAATNNLQMKGVNAAVLMEGQADIDRETQDLRVVVVPEINAMTASLVATAINPVIGLGSFLAQVFLRGPLIEAATQEFHVDGTWADPRVTRVPRRPRDGGAAASPAAPAATPQPTPASPGAPAAPTSALPNEVAS